MVDKNGRAECTPSYLLHDFILLHPRFHCSSRSLPPNPQSLATNTVIYVMNFFFFSSGSQKLPLRGWAGGYFLPVVLLQQLLSNFAAAHGYTLDTLVYKKIQLDTTRKKIKNLKQAPSSVLTQSPQKNQNPQRLNPMQNPKHFCCSRKKKFAARDHHHTFTSNTTGPRKKQKP
jgi:hypothetical protein